MFFTFSKIFNYLLHPFAWVVVLLVITTFIKNPKRKRRLLIYTVLVLILFSNPYLGDEAVRLWEKPDRSVKMLPKSKYTAGILLCGDIVDYDKKINKLIFRSGADRLLQTIDLYKNGVISKIIISGGSGHLLYKDRTEAAFIKQYLIQIGIDDNDILFESTSRNTYENAKYTSLLLKDNEIRGELVLITSALHMRRASATFAKFGLEIEEYPTSKITGHRMNDFDHIAVPSLSTLVNWKILIHEIIGFITYKIMGYC